VRRGHRDPIHARRFPHRDLLLLPPVLHGQAEDHGHRGRIERFKNRYANSPKGEEKKAAPPPAPAPVKAAAKDDNRATKRAKANAGKPKPAPRPEAAPAPASETPEA
jgi:hypothetical protein